MSNRKVGASSVARSRLRTQLLVCGLLGDIAALLVGFQVASLVLAWAHGASPRLVVYIANGSLAIALAAVLGVSVWRGLYKLEAWVSRPLHVMGVLKATVIAMVITAFVSFTCKTPYLSESRLMLYTAFGTYFLLSAWMRVGVLDRLYRRDVRAHRGVTVVVGWGHGGGMLVSRLKELRGFGRVVVLEPSDRRRDGRDADPALLQALATLEPAPRQVFIDGSAIGHKATFDLIKASFARGSDVYVTGRLVSTLDTTHLLLRLFELPVMRARHRPLAVEGERAQRLRGRVKRAFDVAASAAGLVVLAPAFAVIAVLIKLDSPGPVFFRQQRVGKGGVPFEFLKFRTMTAGNDSSRHREYVRGLIASGQAAACNEEGVEVYKLVDDARVTRVGRYLRKWSIDELPQFWNVLRGDMSIVGPRPALDYEVEAYKPWHTLRLRLTPGVSGVWQIAGRSRVGFDEMVFQDVMYAFNESLMTDIVISLRTLPAVLMGTGAA